MKHFCFLFILLSYPALSQDTTCLFSLEGVVTDCEDGKPIEGIIIKLTGSDGSYAEMKTDKAGYYLFDNFKKGRRYINKNTKYIIETATGDIKTHLASSEKGKITTQGLTQAECNKIFKKDFCLKYVQICAPYPSPIFQKNKHTTDSASCPSCRVNIILWRGLLIDNPNIIMDIYGYSTPDEKDTTNLSFKRAESVCSALIKMGVDKNRLTPKGKGCNYYHREKTKINGSNYNIKKANVEKYRAVTFQITGWDYNLKIESPQKKE